ncbi:MAG: carboxypeptidase regulatory-like domain-containing protein [Gammaproteobacteria bacterium]|nr:carboxypeptidase regulatory-like domain-containing protein [Gammaproteobacteria bacterium]
MKIKNLYFILLALILSPSSKAIEAFGYVFDSNKVPLAGVMVTLIEETNGHSVTVYTDESGKYQLQSSLIGQLKLRARTAYYKDQFFEITQNNDDALEVFFALERLQTAIELSNDQTASAHAKQIEWKNEKLKQAFRNQCHFCHQIGNELTRIPKTEEMWQATISRMEGYAVLITDETRKDFAQALSKAFDGKPIEAIQSWDYSPELTKSVYKEWSVGNASSFVHDVEINHHDNSLYGVDMGNDKFYKLDIQSNQMTSIDFPGNNLPMGGFFSGQLAPLGTFNAKQGPHSIQYGPEDYPSTKNKMWTTNSLASEIMSLDVITGEMKVYPIGGDTLYPHTLRFDAKGKLWFTAALSNQIGYFDPETEEFNIINLPSNGFTRWFADAMMPNLLSITSWFPKENLHLDLSHHKMTKTGYDILNLPYGIDISPVDGKVWYSKLNAGYIGFVDPVTLEVTEYKTPKAGPRRFRIDNKGILWIPSFEESALMMFDPKTESFEVFELPLLAPKEYEVPYAVGIHPETQEIWITSNMSDRVFRFNPDNTSWISYPSPTKVNFMRDIVFTSDGGVCSSNANLPAIAIEGGKQKILCIYPDGNLNQN